MKFFSIQGPRQTEVLPLDPTKAPYIPYSTYWKALNLSGLSLTSKQVQLQNLTRLEILDLSGKTACLLKLLNDINLYRSVARFSV